MTGFPDSALTCNDFLGGRLKLWQPRDGYRAGVDPVLLAAAVPAKAGQSVLELGCGAGAAVLCLVTRVPGLRPTGVELQADYAALAARNAQCNEIDLSVHVADLSNMPTDLRQQHFDHVIANPPYYRPGAHSAAVDAGRRTALSEQTPLSDWFDAAARRLTSRGYLHMIQRVERLPDMLSACAGRLGSVEVLPIAPRTGRGAELLILRARKGGRADFQLHAPLILHSGDRHERDGDSYTDTVSGILREGRPMPWPDAR